jgi:hypothetical protein
MTHKNLFFSSAIRRCSQARLAARENEGEDPILTQGSLADAATVGLDYKIPLGFPEKEKKIANTAVATSNHYPIHPKLIHVNL